MSTRFPVLHGHTSPETAYVVADYPYGFRLRCKIRYWLETKSGFGTRFVSQTTNPKKPVEVWNKPRASTYARSGALTFMFLNEKNYVQWTSIDPCSQPAVINSASDVYDFDDAQLQLLVKIENFCRKNWPADWARFDGGKAFRQELSPETCPHHPLAPQHSCQEDRSIAEALRVAWLDGYVAAQRKAVTS